jgi:hypothetical protein
MAIPILITCGCGDGSTPNTDPGSIQIKNLIENERFVTGETIVLDADALEVNGEYHPSGSSGFIWRSNLDGELGSGTVTTALSVGTHTITVSGYGLERTINLRVFQDLKILFSAEPASGEIQRILADFTFNWVDGSTTDPTQMWSSYPGYPFDPSSSAPSKTAVIAKLDALRHQCFSQPLPFGDSRTAYEHLRRYTSIIEVSLGSALNRGGGGAIYLNRNIALWDGTYGYYLGSIFIHENRHNEPGDPGHSSCATAWDGAPGIPNGMDEKFEPGSGYAYYAMYDMWVYKYSIYDPREVRNLARLSAEAVKGRFCTTPSSTNPLLQAIITELWL